MNKNDYNLSCGSTENMSISEIKQAAIRDLNMMNDVPAGVPIDASMINEMRRLQAIITELTALEKEEKQNDQNG